MKKWFKFKISEELEAELLGNGISLDIVYEVKYDCKNDTFCHICFVDDDGEYSELLYKCSDVEKYIASGVWVEVKE